MKNKTALYLHRKTFMYSLGGYTRTLLLLQFIILSELILLTAICTPPCRNGQVCKAPPQTCECISSGGGACTHGMYTRWRY